MESFNEKLSKPISRLAALPIAAGLLVTLVFAVITMAFPAAMIGVGATYLNQCPAQPYIPIWLIVSGSSAIFSLLLIVFMFLLALCGVIGKETGMILAICPCIASGILIILLGFFGFAWFIAGNVWVFSIRNTVDTSNTMSSVYCHETLYLFAFWTIIASYICMGLSCLCSFCSCCCKCIFGCSKD